MRPDDPNRIPTPENPYRMKFFLALATTDPATAKRLFREVLLAERSVPRAAKALGVAEGTVRKLRAEGWSANVRVRGRGRQKKLAA